MEQFVGNYEVEIEAASRQFTSGIGDKKRVLD
jgi:hypothetical protein